MLPRERRPIDETAPSVKEHRIIIKLSLLKSRIIFILSIMSLFLCIYFPYAKRFRRRK